MLHTLNNFFPVRYTAFFLCVLGLLLSGFTMLVFGVGGGWALVFTGLVALGVYDLRQTKRSILRNYPVIGHLRFMLEFVRPEIRQYFLEGDNEASPFSRSQRSLVYQRAKGDPDKRPFGTQLAVYEEGYEWMNHSMTPTQLASHDFRLTIGPDTAQPYEASIFNISAMSFGALSANAILALNSGAKRGGFAHDTGEGSISAHHRVHGGDLIWEIGSGYFGCRNDDGTFNADRFSDNARQFGLMNAAPATSFTTFRDVVIGLWIPLSIALNQINRGMGRERLYPFVIPNAVIDKLEFVASIRPDTRR